ncbi:ferredoxin [Amycolatopsis sp.]|jgi:ferredoxin|uniref:ferredoxin n=1 Tax=Amycolatopsis sp. TaxID=37632 RepID=UPI002E0AD436|nr:ferredoxin [Amycolatopsis sp.]
MEISVDRLLCEANALCVAFAPDVFDLDDDEELVLSTSSPTAEQVERVSQAVTACPKNALLMRS